MLDQLFQKAVQYKGRIVFYFKLFYVFFALFVVFAGLHVYQGGQYTAQFINSAIQSGKVSLVLLLVVLLPGICRRFSLRHRLIDLIMLFRRHLGISVYLFGLYHYVVLRMIIWIKFGLPQIAPFELFGLLALTLMSFMFITSNNFSVRILGGWWKRIHSLVYIIVWLLVFHVGLQRISIWSILIAIIALLEVASYLWKWYVTSSVNSNS